MIDLQYEAIANQDSEPNDGGCISSWSDLTGLFVLIELANRRVKRQGQNLLPGIRPFEHAPEIGLQARNDISRKHFHLVHLIEHWIQQKVFRSRSYQLAQFVDTLGDTAPY